MKNGRSNKSKKAKSTVTFIVLVCIIGLLAYGGFIGVDNIFGYRVKTFEETINRGLDLQGGMSVLEEIKGENVDKDTVNRTIEMLQMRIDPEGIKEVSIKQEGTNKIRIEIPGEFDSKSVLETIGKTGKLEFKGPDDNVILTGADVKNATATLNDLNQPIIALELKEDGTKKFAEATEKFLGQAISIYMDEEVLTSPTVQSIINNGQATISGSTSLEEAQRQANVIKSGALPVTLEAVEYKTVGATLGSNALPLSMKAGAIGIALVLLFILLYYRLPGLMADIALIFYVVLLLGSFAATETTLTLSGIAAFLLTVGMAVDANVLIFERIREELKVGKSIKSSIESGFHRALSSILDSNITTIIAGIVLYYLGTGAVKGFAFTLILGTVLSMFTALTVTRLFVKLGLEMGLFSKASHFRVKRG